MRRGLNKNIVRKRALSVKLSATVLLVSFLLALAGAFPAAALTDGVLDYIVQNGEATVTACRAESETYTLPETVGGYPLTTLGTGFMNENTQVRNLIVPSSVRYVQEQCFRDNTRLREVRFQGPVTFERQVFYLAQGIEEVYLAEGQTALGDQMFRSSSLQRITLPSTLQTINYEAFYKTEQLSQIEIPASVTYIGDGAFYSDTALDGSLTFHENVTYIGDNAFINCVELDAVTILNATCDIAPTAFSQCVLDVYGRSNSTALAICEYNPSLRFHCATDDDHTYADEWTVALTPTTYRNGLEVCACRYCGATMTRILQKLQPTEEPERWNTLVSGDGYNHGFTDVESGAWYESDLCFVAANELFAGTSETEFSPNVVMDRAMFVTVLWRMAGMPQATEYATFTDIELDGYYTAALDWAVSEGIISGVSETSFAPHDPTERQQACAMLYRFASVIGLDTAADSSLDAFSDADSVASYAQTAFSWAVEHGVIQGDGDLLQPTDDITRAEMAAILHRMWSNLIESSAVS